MGLANRLALLFALIVLGAISAVYFAIVPRLSDSLRTEKLNALTADAETYREALEDTIGTSKPQEEVRRILREAGTRSDARVTLFNVAQLGERSNLVLYEDSEPDLLRDADDLQFAVAEEALATRRTATGTEPSRSGRVAEAALPLMRGGRVARVVVFSGSLSDVQSTVGVVNRRFLLAGATALLLAMLAGYFVARMFSDRVRRLERAARRVAAGDFSDRIEADGRDELGQLAAAFDDMQRQLAQLDDARRRFIATASHELRTPVFSLGGFLELLAEEDLDDDTRREFVAQLRGQVERLTKLATELLDLSRLEAGPLQLRPEPTDVGALVREVADEFGPALAAHHSALEVRVPPEGIETECDPDRVAQVLRILIDNAVVHTPEGTGIVVAAGRENGHLRLAVSDRGLGINRQSVNRIFEPFFKSDDAPGAGLGLAIAHELAEKMDGRLEVESRTGLTTFAFELPVER